MVSEFTSWSLGSSAGPGGGAMVRTRVRAGKSAGLETGAFDGCEGDSAPLGRAQWGACAAGAACGAPLMGCVPLDFCRNCEIALESAVLLIAALDSACRNNMFERFTFR